MRTANPSTALFLLLAAALPAGEGPDSPVWDKVIARQPFDRAPFRRVRVPEWVKDTVGAGYTLSGMGSEDRRKAAAAGVTLSELGFVDPFYAYYESKLLSRRSPHVPMGRLEKDIAEYKRLGIRILGVYPPCLQGEVYEKHPDWRRVAADTSEVPQVDLVKYPHGGMLCLLGPYGDFFIEVLAEILTLYPDVDAFSFDGLHHGGFCYCRHCREDYRKDTGLEIPRVDLEDPAFRRYQHWADRRLESLIQRMQTRLKGLKPEVALVTWTTNAGRFGHLRDIPRNMPARMNLLLDAPDQELWLDETNRGATVLPSFASAYIYALTDHRVAFSEPYLMSHGNPYGKDSFPAHEVERRMMLVLTHGACPSIAVSQPGDLQAAVVHGLAEVGRRKRWLVRKEPEPWAAILMSDDTRNFYGRSPGRVEERYVSHVLGAFRAALEEHLPAALVCDWNLNSEDLAKYRVLVLPDAACLDDEQVEAVRGFVEKGGGLVASLDTSLFDASGNPREDFALGRVLGVRYRGLPDSKAAGEIDVNFARGLGPDYWEKRKGVFELKLKEGSPLDSPRLTEYLGGAPVTFKGPAVKVRVEPVPRAAPAPGTAPGAAAAAVEEIATLRPGPGVEGAEGPAIVAGTFGRGKVVYLAAGFDAAYYLYPYPYQRLLLKRAIEWAAATAAPVAVEAPMCVQTALFRQKRDGERLVLHLFNDLNTTAFHGLPNDDVPLREEVVPIPGIKVTFRGYRIGRVHQEPEGNALEPEKVGDGLRFTVPVLSVHSMVVAELE